MCRFKTFIGMFLWGMCLVPLLLAGDGELVIFHTNDIHGGFISRPASWLDERPLIGGFAPLSGALAVERSGDISSLLMDAGDFMTGNPITDLDVDGTVGGAMLEFFDLLGYDVITLGNHEFDVSSQNAKRLATTSKVPIVSANIRMTTDPEAGVKQPSTELLCDRGWEIFQVDDIRVGVIGVVMEDLAGMINKTAMAALSIGSPVEETQKTVDMIDQKTDLIVLLTHNGFDEDLELARNVTGVDVIVGGHSHTRVEPPAVVNGVIVVQAGSNCRNLGRLRLKVEDDRVVEHDGSLIPLWADSLPPVPEVAERVQYYQEMLDREFGKVIAQLEEDWSRSGSGESPLGKWLADRLREFGNGDFAVVNSGGIRRNLQAGPVTIMDIKEMLPFSNRVVSFRCTGEQLMKLVQNNAGSGGTSGREMLQVSGLIYKIIQDDKGMFAATDVIVNGEPLDLDGSYKGISIDYVVVSQAERYFTFVPDNYEDMGVGFTDLIIEEIAKRGSLEKPTDQRVLR